MRAVFILIAAVAWIGSALAQAQEAKGTMFKDDLSFLQQHTEVVVLSDVRETAQVIVAPAYQGRVMTSTGGGPEGLSFGWINRELIASGKRLRHINPYGGEDRFWLGPEGGQFSIFFAKGVPFDLANWFTPPAIDVEPFELVGKTEERASFQKQMRLINYSGFTFDLEVNRDIRLLEAVEMWRRLEIPMTSGLKTVSYESVNRITNKGAAPWDKKTGLLSIWILGMYNPSPATTVVIPFEPGAEAERGPVVNDAYFGKVPPDRLKVGASCLFFSGDGKHRSKIGLSKKRARPIIGSYDAANKALTLVQYSLPTGPALYVNSMWQLQEDPYSGDVVNSYNDGPPAPDAKPLGPFYELETSSPAAALKPEESIGHMHRTIHLQGEEALLDLVAKAALGVGIEEIKNALKQ